MCSGTIPVFGILAIVPYQGTGINVLMMELATSIRVFKKTQNNLGESTHLIGSTRLMQTMTQLSLIAYGLM